jgi:hypothetical protein
VAVSMRIHHSCNSGTKVKVTLIINSFNEYIYGMMRDDDIKQNTKNDMGLI